MNLISLLSSNEIVLIVYVNKNSRDNIYAKIYIYIYIAFEKGRKPIFASSTRQEILFHRSKEMNHKSKLIHLETNTFALSLFPQHEIFTSDTPLRFHLIERISGIEYLFDKRVIKHFAKLLFGTLTTSFERHKCSKAWELCFKAVQI